MITPRISLGMIAWNEEDSIGAALKSVFQQSLFSRLNKRTLTVEILCLTNGCTDATVRVAQEMMDAQSKDHPGKDAFTCLVVNLVERGKLNAWNVFVHKLSAPGAQFLFLMDGDIVIHHPDTLWNMFTALLEQPEATIAVDHPLKDISFKARPSFREQISLATSTTTGAGVAQVTGQLYAIRAGAARNIYLPRDLPACEDGFIKALVCTDSLTRPAWAKRVTQAVDASHVFESYASVADILKNQKRQMIGQTIVHLLVDEHLNKLSRPHRMHLGAWLRNQDAIDPDWLKRLIRGHVLKMKHCWQLFPGIPGSRFKRLARLKGLRRVSHLPAALIGFLVTMASAWLAFRALKRGCTDYWPDTKSVRLGQHLSVAEAPPAVLPT